MQRTSLSEISCSLARTFQIIGEWWTPLVLRDLFVGLTRFEDIRRDLGIASNVLTERLVTLTEHGIVERRQYQANPARFEYRLTKKGEGLFPAFAQLMRWGDEWESAEGPPALLVHESCGAVTHAIAVCAHCHEELAAPQVTAIAGPGGRIEAGTELIGPILAQRTVARNATEAPSRASGTRKKGRRAPLKRRSR
jgi:DNA-binding HxlR family transcriptional regulator